MHFPGLRKLGNQDTLGKNHILGKWELVSNFLVLVLAVDTEHGNPAVVNIFHPSTNQVMESFYK